MEAITVDRTAAAAAEIATLRQELAAAKARIQEMGRHNATEADEPFASWKSRTPTLDDLRERMAVHDLPRASSRRGLSRQPSLNHAVTRSAPLLGGNGHGHGRNTNDPRGAGAARTARQPRSMGTNSSLRIGRWARLLLVLGALPGTINADHWACDLAGAYHKRAGMLFDQGRKCVVTSLSLAAKRTSRRTPRTSYSRKLVTVAA
jgi:hypothetical protein